MGVDREIARLAIPAFGSLVAEPLYVLADTAVVGHLGTPELGGLAVASTVLIGLWSLCIFLAYGTTAAVARHTGAGDPIAALDDGVQSLWLAALIGVGLTVVGVVAAPLLVDLLGASSTVRPHALLYLRLAFPGVPALLIALAATGYRRGIGDARTPLVVTVVASLANLVAEVVLVLGLGWGLAASALTTVAVQWAVAGWYLWATRRAASGVVSVRPRARAISALASLGGPLIVRTAALRAAYIATIAAAARLGTTSLAAHHIVLEWWNTLALALDSVAIAGQTLIGTALGRRDVDAVRTLGRRMLVWGLGLGLVLGAATLLARSVVVGVFTPDERVAALAAEVLVVAALIQPLCGLVYVLDGVLIGAADNRFLAVAMAGATALYVPVAALAVSRRWPLWVLWVGLAWFMVARAVPLSRRFRSWAWISPDLTLRGGTATG